MENSNQIILQGIGLDTLIDHFRQVVRSELKNIPTKELTPEIGGIELATKITGLSKASVYRFTCEGTIPYHKKGGKLFFKTSELVKWIESGNSAANG
jgi:predicted DNA-binding transcriptional regulator AlpA